MSGIDRPTTPTDSSGEEIIDLDNTSEGENSHSDLLTVGTLDREILTRIREFPKTSLVDFEDIRDPGVKSEAYRQVPTGSP